MRFKLYICIHWYNSQIKFCCALMKIKKIWGSGIPMSVFNLTAQSVCEQILSLRASECLRRPCSNSEDILSPSILNHFLVPGHTRNWIIKLYAAKDYVFRASECYQTFKFGPPHMYMQLVSRGGLSNVFSLISPLFVDSWYCESVCSGETCHIESVSGKSHRCKEMEIPVKYVRDM